MLQPAFWGDNDAEVVAELENLRSVREDSDVFSKALSEAHQHVNTLLIHATHFPGDGPPDRLHETVMSKRAALAVVAYESGSPEQVREVKRLYAASDQYAALRELRSYARWLAARPSGPPEKHAIGLASGVIQSLAGLHALEMGADVIAGLASAPGELDRVLTRLSSLRGTIPGGPSVLKHALTLKRALLKRTGGEAGHSVIDRLFDHADQAVTLIPGVPGEEPSEGRLVGIVHPDPEGDSALRLVLHTQEGVTTEVSIENVAVMADGHTIVAAGETISPTLQPSVKWVASVISELIPRFAPVSERYDLQPAGLDAIDAILSLVVLGEDPSTHLEGELQEITQRLYQERPKRYAGLVSLPDAAILQFFERFKFTKNMRLEHPAAVALRQSVRAYLLLPVVTRLLEEPVGSTERFNAAYVGGLARFHRAYGYWVSPGLTSLHHGEAWRRRAQEGLRSGEDIFRVLKSGPPEARRDTVLGFQETVAEELKVTLDALPLQPEYQDVIEALLGSRARGLEFLEELPFYVASVFRQVAFSLFRADEQLDPYSWTYSWRSPTPPDALRDAIKRAVDGRNKQALIKALGELPQELREDAGTVTLLLLTDASPPWATMKRFIEAAQVDRMAMEYRPDE
ncbi:MAG TPA: hypothetical protein VEY30_01300 [Myxococcaceae bacterium]|nr:hypothetical protein [Myxococcaceae bacterium]